MKSKLSAALMGAAVVLGSSVLAPSARADSMVFDLDQSNLGAGFTGPFIRVTVDQTGTPTVPIFTFTFDSLTNGGFTYLMPATVAQTGTAAVNILPISNAGLVSATATNSLSGFATPNGLNNGGQQPMDGFGGV